MERKQNHISIKVTTERATNKELVRDISFRQSFIPTNPTACNFFQWGTCLGRGSFIMDVVSVITLEGIILMSPDNCIPYAHF